MNARLWIVGTFLLTLAVFTAACGGHSSTLNIKLDVGGQVVNSDLPNYPPVAGATVTLTDVRGNTRTATTTDQGLWTFEKLEPGTYVVRFEAAGFQPEEDTLELDVNSETNIGNGFYSWGTTYLYAKEIHVDVQPFGVGADGYYAFASDGFNGQSLVYKKSSNGSVVLTFDRKIQTLYWAYLEDDNDTAYGTLDTAGQTVLTFKGTDIQAMNGGSGIHADDDPSTIDYLYVYGYGLNQINGDTKYIYLEMYFNAVP